MDDLSQIFLQQASENLNLALAKGLPAFFPSIEESSPQNSTPYYINHLKFENLINKDPERILLWNRLSKIVKLSGDNGYNIELALLGGSFLQFENKSPNDVDCILFYTKKNAGNNISKISLNDIQAMAKKNDVDARLIPIDCNPVLLIKIASYFTSLYSIAQDNSGKPLFLVDYNSL